MTLPRTDPLDIIVTIDRGSDTLDDLGARAWLRSKITDESFIIFCQAEAFIHIFFFEATVLRHGEAPDSRGINKHERNEVTTKRRTKQIMRKKEWIQIVGFDLRFKHRKALRRVESAIKVVLVDACNLLHLRDTHVEARQRTTSSPGLMVSMRSSNRRTSLLRGRRPGGTEPSIRRSGQLQARNVRTWRLLKCDFLIISIDSLRWDATKMASGSRINLLWIQNKRAWRLTFRTIRRLHFLLNVVLIVRTQQLTTMRAVVHHIEQLTINTAHHNNAPHTWGNTDVRRVTTPLTQTSELRWLWRRSRRASTSGSSSFERRRVAGRLPVIRTWTAEWMFP